MDDIQFHRGSSYRLVGNSSTKPTLVLIHGVGLNQDMWLPWIPILQPHFAVLTFDLLGHGQSGNPAGRRTMVGFANQLHQLLAHLKIERFALAGFSLGALISQAFASLHSRRLTHLILLHSVYQRTKEQCDLVRERYQITQTQGGPMATVELAIVRWFTEPYRLAHEQEMEQLREIFSRHTDDGYLKAYYLFCNAEAEMQHYPLEQIACPALVVTGSDDVGSTPEMAKAMAKALSKASTSDLTNTELIINPGHRHMAPAEFAETIANQALSFLTTHC